MPKLPLNHIAPRVQMANIHRATAKRAKSPYNYKWQKYRERFLRANPLCADCRDRNLVVEATVVDHKIPHKNDPVLMWDPLNHRASCVPCHNAKTAALDGGFGNQIKNDAKPRRSFNPDGTPTDGW